MPGLSFPFLLLIASAILFAPLASWLALQRERSWALWFLFGVALGPVASLLLVLAPPGRCPACGTPTVGWPRGCPDCGLVFGAPAGRAALPTMIGRASAADAGTAAIVAAESAGRGPTPRTEPARNLEAATTVASPVASPVRRPAGIEPASRSATALGRRATIEAAEAARTTPAPAEAPRATPPAAPRPAAGTLAILGSGVFIGGSESLQVGSRYLLARVGADLHVLGPVHISPAAIAARISLAGVEPTLLADRLLLTSIRPGRGSNLAFGGVSLESGVDVARDLRAPRKRRPASP